MWSRSSDQYGGLFRITPGAAPAVKDRDPGQVIAVFSPKGGVGRTTVAVNLAVAAATDLGRKVVLVDASSGELCAGSTPAQPPCELSVPCTSTSGAPVPLCW